MIFAQSWTERAPPAPVIWPKVELEMPVSGLFHCGVLIACSASARNCSFHRSVIRKLRNSDASRFQKPGPSIGFQPRLPNSGLLPTGVCSAPGWAKQLVVTRGLDVLKLQIVLLNQCTPRPVPCVIAILSGPNQFSVLLFCGALRIAE